MKILSPASGHCGFTQVQKPLYSNHVPEREAILEAQQEICGDQDDETRVAVLRPDKREVCNVQEYSNPSGRTHANQTPEQVLEHRTILLVRVVGVCEIALKAVEIE